MDTLARLQVSLYISDLSKARVRVASSAIICSSLTIPVRGINLCISIISWKFDTRAFKFFVHFFATVHPPLVPGWRWIAVNFYPLAIFENIDPTVAILVFVRWH